MIDRGRQFVLWASWALMASCVMSILSEASDACECNTTENRAVLLEFNAAMHGEQWAIRWETTMGVCDWYGVNCSGPHVIILKVSENNLSGTLPESLGNLTHIESFDVDKNDVHGTLPSRLSQWTNLAYLDVSNCNLSGSIPGAYSSWGKLRKVQLHHNQLSGTLPASLRRWASVWHIDLGYNRLTGTLPAEYSALAPTLLELYVEYNFFHGTIPPSYAQWNKLVTFHAQSANALTGPFPEDIFRNWTEIQSINLNQNEFYGTLPNNFFPKHILRLYLVANAFSGTLPASWSRMGLTLTDFAVASNLLEGTLPDAFSMMTSLSRLLIHNNRFTGTLPASWGELRLSALFLQNNNLVGTIPSSWASIFAGGEVFPLCTLCATNICGHASQVGLGVFSCLDASVLNKTELSDLLVNLTTVASIPCPTTTAVPNSSNAPPSTSFPVQEYGQSTASSSTVVSTGALIWGKVVAPLLMASGGSHALLRAGSSAGGLQGTYGILRLAYRCNNAAAAGGGDATPPLGTSTLDNPTHINIGNAARLAPAAGALLGNTVLAVVVGALPHLFKVWHNTLKSRGRGTQRGRAPLWYVAAILSRCPQGTLPGSLLIGYMMLQVPTVACAVYIVSIGSAGAVVAAAAVLALWVLPIAGTALKFYGLERHKISKGFRVRPTPKQTRKGTTSSCVNFLREWSSPTHCWKLANDSHAHRHDGLLTWWSQWEPLLAPFRHLRYRHVLVECGAQACIGVVLGVASGADDPCYAARWGSATVTALTAVLLLLHVLLRPLSSRLENASTAVVLLIAVAAEVSVCVGAEDESEALALTATISELAWMVLLALIEWKFPVERGLFAPPVTPRLTLGQMTTTSSTKNVVIRAGGKRNTHRTRRCLPLGTLPWADLPTPQQINAPSSSSW